MDIVGDITLNAPYDKHPYFFKEIIRDLAHVRSKISSTVHFMRIQSVDVQYHPCEL